MLGRSSAATPALTPARVSTAYSRFSVSASQLACSRSPELAIVVHGAPPGTLPVIRTVTGPRSPASGRAMCERKSVRLTRVRKGYAGVSARRTACSSASTGPLPVASPRRTSPPTATSAEATDTVPRSSALLRESTAYASG